MPLQPVTCNASEAYTEAEAEAEAEDKNVLASGFDAFWLAYPKKRGKDDARKAWKARKLERDHETQAAILAALDWQREQPDWRKDGGQFIPLPATWLRAGRWQDEPTVVAQHGLSDRHAQGLANALEAERMMLAAEAARNGRSK
jgi:hypothetical protein